MLFLHAKFTIVLFMFIFARIFKAKIENCISLAGTKFQALKNLKRDSLCSKGSSHIRFIIIFAIKDEL